MKNILYFFFHKLTQLKRVVKNLEFDKLFNIFAFLMVDKHQNFSSIYIRGQHVIKGTFFMCLKYQKKI